MRQRATLLFSLSVLLVNILGCGGGSSAPTQPASNPIPAIATLTPATATAGAPDTAIAAEGSGFVAGTTLDWNGTSLATTYSSPTQLSAKVPASLLANGTTGKVTAVSPSPGGGTSEAVSFVVNNPAPALTTTTPGSTVAGGGDLTLSLTGSGFVPSSTVTLNGRALVTTFVSGAMLTAVLPAASQAVGAVDTLAISNPTPAGGVSGQVSFTVNNPIPSVLNVNPASIATGAAATQLSITGTGFVPNSVISWNGAALTTTFVSSTSLQAVLPAADAATAAVGSLTAANPAPVGGVSAPLSFAVDNALPALASIIPTSVSAGAGATTLTVAGTHFAPTSLVNWNGTPLATTYVSSTSLTAVVPASDLSAGIATLLTISSPAPGGGTSAALTFDVNSPTPVLSSITPLFVPTNKAATVTLIGSGFESTSTVFWNGAARPSVVVSSIMLQVMLTAADLQQDGIGSLSVINPGPGGATSSPATLTATSQPIPAITAASVTLLPGSGTCSQLLVTLSGANFSSYSSIQVNGVALQRIEYLGDLSSISDFLPASFFSKPGALSFTVTNPGSPSIGSVPFSYPPTSPTVLGICPVPSPATVYDASSFSVLVQPTEVNATGAETVSLGTLPAGITSTSNSVPIPANGAILHFQVAPSAPAGSYSVALNGNAGADVDTEALALTVSASAPPGFYFTQPTPGEVGVSFGGSGATQFSSFGYSYPPALYDITPSISGLPLGTTASFSPSVFSPGQSVTVTVTAASNAPMTQNASVALTGTPVAAAAPATGSFLLDVTQPPGSLPNSRTDFTSTAGTPLAAVYDAVHNLIFSSNPAWNRVDVLSDKTHQLMTSIPVLDPRGIDITQDSAHLWVSTDSRQIYSINTATFAVTRFTLPTAVVNGDRVDGNNHDRVLALADGTLFLFYSNGDGEYAGVWDPVANTYTNLNGNGIYPPFGIPTRSGDGTHVFAPTGSLSATGITVYSTATKSVTTVSGPTPYGALVAVNAYGTRLVSSNGQSLSMVDQNLQVLGSVPGTLPGSGPAFILNGGAVFSPDGQTLYVIGEYDNQATVLTIDVASLQLLGIAPSAPTDPVGTSGFAGTATPLAVDSSKMVLGIENYGISFDDATFYQNYATNQPGVNGSTEFLATYAGPLAGGTLSSLYVYPSLTPDVWFGQTRGATDISQGELTFTSPPSTVPGPVNVKFIYPDGTQMFYPQLFGYSTFPEYAVMSGSSPNGGAAAQVIGYGLPQDPSQGSMTIGGSSATITTMTSQYPPFSGEPYPSTVLSYIFPAGSPGYADLQITTPNGTGTLPKSIFYAKSVTDYASTDTFTSVLFDASRSQVYLTAGDHVDVFSTASNAFAAPLYPAAAGSVKEFSGLAMTPDKSQLLVTDLADGSLAVINPDLPSSTYSIAITPEYSPFNNCVDGPLYVAATSNRLAFVTTGSLPAPSCPTEGLLYVANLQSRTAAEPSASQCQFLPPGSSGSSVAASSDGNVLAISGTTSSTGYGGCIYSAPSGTYTPAALPGPSLEISGDANVFAAGTQLADSTATLLGSLAKPLALYPTNALSTLANVPLQRPRLNASGSLQYTAFSNYFEIEDVLHARLLMRFSLAETVQNTGSPIAIDDSGRFVFLITTQGFTVIDMGAAPLAIGHLSQTSAPAGASVTIRGSGFDASTRATVGGQSAAVTVTDQNTLTLSLPSVPSGPTDIVLTRSDGVSYTLESGVTIQ